MKRLFKWLLGLVAFVAVLLVLAVVLLPMFFDPNEHKPQIQQAIAENIGREVKLDGPIEWSVFPWVAINLSDVSIANEAGFKGDYLAEIEQVAVRVKLLPLLKKQIKVGQVELIQPVIHLQIAQSGKSNWQSITEHMDQGSSEPVTNDSGPTDLEIRGIGISNGRVNYADGAADLRVQLSDLSFNSEAIKAGSPTAMALNGQIEIAAQELQGQLQASWQANGITDNAGMRLNFDELQFVGQLGQLPLKVETDGQTEIDLTQDTLTVNDVALAYGQVNINTPIQGQQISTNMSLKGQLNMAEFSLADMLADLGSPLDNQANNDLSGQMSWSMIGDRLQLNDIDVTLDESVIKGSIDIKQLSQLRGQFDLNINQLNLDQYLPNDESASSGSTNKGSAAMDLGQMTGQIKMNQLIAAGVNLDDITLKIRTQGKNLTIEPLQADFYQGLIKTELSLKPDSTTEKLTLTHSMQDFQAGGLLTDLMGTDYLTGLGQLNAAVKIDEPFADRPFKTANGSLSYRLTDGDIVGIDIFQIMQQSLSLLNKTDAVKANSELKTAFGLMEIQADINQGILKTNTLKLNSPYFEMKGSVEIDLDQQTIKGTIQPMLTNIPEGVLDKNFQKLINLRIPVSLKGNLLAPDVSIDVAKLLLATQKEKIDQKKEELKEDLFNKLLGNDKEDKKGKNNKETNDSETLNQNEEQPELTEKQKKRAEKDKLKRDLLEGLFKSKKDKTEETEETEDGGGN